MFRVCKFLTWWFDVLPMDFSDPYLESRVNHILDILPKITEYSPVDGASTRDFLVYSWRQSAQRLKSRSHKMAVYPVSLSFCPLPDLAQNHVPTLSKQLRLLNEQDKSMISKSEISMLEVFLFYGLILTFLDYRLRSFGTRKANHSFSAPVLFGDSVRRVFAEHIS